MHVKTEMVLILDISFVKQYVDNWKRRPLKTLSKQYLIAYIKFAKAIIIVNDNVFALRKIKQLKIITTGPVYCIASYNEECMFNRNWLHACPVNKLYYTGGMGTIPEPWFNIKMSSYRYRKSHCGDKTVVRSSYLHNGISYTGKMTSFYWIRAQVLTSALCHVFSVSNGQCWLQSYIHVYSDLSVTWMALCNMHIALYSHWYIEAESKRTIFCRQNFQMNFLVRILLYCDLNFTEMCFKVPIKVPLWPHSISN